MAMQIHDHVHDYDVDGNADHNNTPYLLSNAVVMLVYICCLIPISTNAIQNDLHALSSRLCDTTEALLVVIF